ncbi:MAG: DUF4097 domain-containing protein [Lachnospiraceae bacterium]|nr:DUF4097 domain-containing protein [Lachnospiraceae bacterium]
MNHSWTKSYKIILWIITLIVIICALSYHIFNFGTKFFHFGKAEPAGEMQTFDFSDVEAMDRLDIDMDAADIDIIYGDSLGISHNYPEKYKPSISCDQNKLSVTQEMKVTNLNSIEGYKITITLPVGTTLKDLNMKIDAGDIKIEEVAFERSDISVDAGNLNIKKASLGDLSIDADLGNIELDGVSFDNGTIDADCGNIDVDGTFNGLKANCDLGSIKVNAPDVDESNLDLDCSLGSISVNGKKWS